MNLTTSVTPKHVFIGVVIFALICMIICDLRYWNCLLIIKNQLNCFKDKANGRLQKIPIFVAFILPVFLAFATEWKVGITESVVNILTVIISVLMGVFLASTPMLIDIKKNVEQENRPAGETTLINTLLREIHYIIMFQVLMCTVVLILCFLSAFSGVYLKYVSILIYYLSYVMLLNIFMLLKRLNLVFGKELE